MISEIVRILKHNHVKEEIINEISLILKHQLMIIPGSVNKNLLKKHQYVVFNLNFENLSDCVLYKNFNLTYIDELLDFFQKMRFQSIFKATYFL